MSTAPSRPCSTTRAGTSSTSGLPLPDAARRGRVERPPEGGPGWGQGRPQARGAILYRDREGRGPYVFFDRDVPDLDRTRFGRRMASSVDVSPGCILTLYELPGYRGRKTEFFERDNNLKNTAVGEDSASSLRIRCR